MYLDQGIHPDPTLTLASITAKGRTGTANSVGRNKDPRLNNIATVDWKMATPKKANEPDVNHPNPTRQHPNPDTANRELAIACSRDGWWTSTANCVGEKGTSQ